MKYVADRGYKDLQLNRHVNKGEELETIYKEAGVELTEERIEYLVDKRKLYNAVDGKGKEEGKQDVADKDNKEEKTSEAEENKKEIEKENESEAAEEEATSKRR